MDLIGLPLTSKERKKGSSFLSALLRCLYSGKGKGKMVVFALLASGNDVGEEHPIIFIFTIEATNE